MKTQAEIAAQKMISSKTCMNCIYSKPGRKRKQPVLKCSLTERVVLPRMLGCLFWKRKTR